MASMHTTPCESQAADEENNFLTITAKIPGPGAAVLHIWAESRWDGFPSYMLLFGESQVHRDDRQDRAIIEEIRHPFHWDSQNSWNQETGCNSQQKLSKKTWNSQRREQRHKRTMPQKSQEREISIQSELWSHGSGEVHIIHWAGLLISERHPAAKSTWYKSTSGVAVRLKGTGL